MTDPQDRDRATPAARRQRRSRVAAVGASLGAALVLTGGLALANQGTTNGGGSSDTIRKVAHAATATGGGRDAYGDDGYPYDGYGNDPYRDDGGWFSDDSGDRRDSNSGGAQTQSPSPQPSTSSGGS